jgi:hypothetical protein
MPKRRMSLEDFLGYDERRGIGIPRLEVLDPTLMPGPLEDSALDRTGYSKGVVGTACLYLWRRQILQQEAQRLLGYVFQSQRRLHGGHPPNDDVQHRKKSEDQEGFRRSGVIFPEGTKVAKDGINFRVGSAAPQTPNQTGHGSETVEIGRLPE